jgi:hypothetical protein
MINNGITDCKEWKRVIDSRVTDLQVQEMNVPVADTSELTD